MLIAGGGVDAKTMRKHVWPMIGSVYELNYSVVSLLTLLFAMCQIQLFSHLFLLSHCQILWENRKRGDVGNDYLVSNNRTDLPLAKSYVKELWSYKFKHSALRYEVALCIKTGDICWWNGPFEPGIYNDEMIFKMGLLGMLEQGERVETDRSY